MARAFKCGKLHGHCQGVGVGAARQGITRLQWGCAGRQERIKRCQCIHRVCQIRVTHLHRHANLRRLSAHRLDGRQIRPVISLLSANGNVVGRQRCVGARGASVQRDR